uniref:Spermatogenesis and centriole associated 1 n=1 Tax=Molossus molossus TaxID=27622 RepID=A0A7J8BAQ8_MOLMO|nr:spermatogenesis and centriole associated 1 [Molossus molossus]
MSLLTNYEGLRHQIERLVRENEELKKLVRLIRENHELKSAIKTQAGALNISGFTSGLGEAATGPSQQQGVFLTPSQAATNEPVLEEMGMMALAPLADMLNNPQPSPAAGPIVSPLTGPLNTLLPSPGPITQNSALASLLTGPLSSHLASPMAVPTGGTLTSSLGLPSTGPLTPNSNLSGPMASTLASSLGLPSTGPLTPSSNLSGPMANTLASSLGLPSTGPLTPSSNLSGPMANTLASSLGLPSTGPLTPSSPLAGPLAMSQSNPLMAPMTGTVAVSLNGPLLTSTTAPSVPTTPMASSTVEVLPSAPAHQAATNYSPSSTTHIAQSTTRAHHSPTRPSPTSHSPPRNPHSPPRTSSSPASVNDTRGPRISETCRKSILDLERKLAHRKTSKFPESPREPKQLALERLVGEIAFQLDRRILSSIFPERVRLYGFTVSNIPEKIIQASLNPGSHKLDEELCQTLTQRYVSIMNRLQSLGYNGRVHPALTEQLVNAYGILRERPELAVSEGGSYTVDFLQRVLVETVHPSMLTDALLLLSCLSQLAHDDGKPMFIW